MNHFTEQQLNRISSLISEIEKLSDVEKLFLYLQLPCGRPNLTNDSGKFVNGRLKGQPANVVVDNRQQHQHQQQQQFNLCILNDNCDQQQKNLVGLVPKRPDQETTQTYTWILSHLEVDPNVSLPKQEVYDEYKNFCHQNQIESLCVADFGKAMKYAFPCIKPRRLGQRGNSRYCYSGLRKRYKLDPPTLPDLENAGASSRLVNPNQTTQTNDQLQMDIAHDDTAISDSGLANDNILMGGQQQCELAADGSYLGSMGQADSRQLSSDSTDQVICIKTEHSIDTNGGQFNRHHTTSSSYDTTPIQQSQQLSTYCDNSNRLVTANGRYETPSESQLANDNINNNNNGRQSLANCNGHSSKNHLIDQQQNQIHPSISSCNNQFQQQQTIHSNHQNETSEHHGQTNQLMGSFYRQANYEQPHTYHNQVTYHSQPMRPGTPDDDDYCHNYQLVSPHQNHLLNHQQSISFGPGISLAPMCQIQIQPQQQQHNNNDQSSCSAQATTLQQQESNNPILTTSDNNEHDHISPIEINKQTANRIQHSSSSNCNNNNNNNNNNNYVNHYQSREPLDPLVGGYQPGKYLHNHKRLATDQTSHEQESLQQQQSCTPMITNDGQFVGMFTLDSCLSPYQSPASTPYPQIMSVPLVPAADNNNTTTTNDNNNRYNTTSINTSPYVQASDMMINDDVMLSTSSNEQANSSLSSTIQYMSP